MLTLTDVHSGCTECAALAIRKQNLVVEGISAIELTHVGTQYHGQRTHGAPLDQVPQYIHWRNSGSLSGGEGLADDQRVASKLGVHRRMLISRGARYLR